MGINIALVGNPNCGKTTLFNDLTGANQYTGNWPGVTVEKKTGKYRREKDVLLTDLPGVYSLSPYTPEEVVTRDFLLSDEPDVVVNIVDATNLERNLYLTTQVLNLGLPTVVALNMMDLIEKNGDTIDTEKLSRELGCPIVEISALKGKNTAEVIETAKASAKQGVEAASKLRFSDDVESALNKVIDILGDAVAPRERRWFAIKCLEGEPLTIDRLDLKATQLSQIDAIRASVEEAEDDDIESVLTNERYDAITDVCDACIKKSAKGLTTTQKIDRVVTNRVLGIPIFIVVMFVVYYFAVSLGGGIVTDWANDGISGDGWLYTGTEQYEEAVGAWEDEMALAEESGASEAELELLAEEEPDPASGEYGLWIPGLSPVVTEAMESVDAAPWLISLVVDGIIAGVGAVIGFIPQLIILFLFLGFLEGCGYMARVAFIMDRIFRRFGLSGKSFIPMLIASGCGVPAVMATKTIENEKDRRMTIMTTTMIPCGAKLPIIALVFGALSGTFFEDTWWVAPMFYFLGLAAIVVSCIMLRKLKTFAGEAAPFIMELPAYHLPTVKNVLLSMWERVKAYIVKAGTIIFLSSIVIWFLLNFGVYEGAFGLLDPEIEDYYQYSIMAGLGSVLCWIFAPLGFGNWEATVTSITGLVAKENVVATVGIITSLGEVGEDDPTIWLSFAEMMGGTSVAIMAFCAFNLLCAPCFAAIGAIRNQMRSAKWTWAAIGYMCVFGWVVGLEIYQLGGLATGEVAFNFWTVIAIILLALMLFQLFRPMPKYNKEANERAQEIINAEGAKA
ncbi:MAG: ferrous iron transporter B [Eggerthellaceae bacterium]|nr:ferrous iron transporter B [Eggerthellaceae bacterium]